MRGIKEEMRKSSLSIARPISHGVTPLRALHNSKWTILSLALLYYEFTIERNGLATLLCTNTALAHNAMLK